MIFYEGCKQRAKFSMQMMLVPTHPTVNCYLSCMSAFERYELSCNGKVKVLTAVLLLKIRK